MEWLLDINWR